MESSWWWYKVDISYCVHLTDWYGQSWNIFNITESREELEDDINNFDEDTDENVLDTCTAPKKAKKVKILYSYKAIKNQFLGSQARANLFKYCALPVSIIKWIK